MVYASHAVYCALLCMLLTRFEQQTPPHTDAQELLLFLRVFAASSVVLLCLAVILDLNGVRYSTLSDALRPPRLVDGPSIALLGLPLCANLAGCVGCMWLHRIIFGFSLRSELTGSALLMLLCNAANLRYNASATSRLRPFWKSKGLDVDMHMRWSAQHWMLEPCLRGAQRAAGSTRGDRPDTGQHGAQLSPLQSLFALRPLRLGRPPRAHAVRGRARLGVPALLGGRGDADPHAPHRRRQDAAARARANSRPRVP